MDETLRPVATTRADTSTLWAVKAEQDDPQTIWVPSKITLGPVSLPIAGDERMARELGTTPEHGL